MATNFGTIETFVSEKFKFNRSYATVYHIQDGIHFVGLTPSTVQVIIDFDLPPILTGASLVAGNWAISGAGSPSVSSVAVNANQIQLTVTGLSAGTTYALTVPSGITADSGTPGEPLLYSGPNTLTIGLASGGAGGGSAFNRGMN